MGKDFITPAGYQKLQEELRDLKYKERPQVTETVAWAASNGDRSENGDYLYGKKRLREIDRRLGYLSRRLDELEVIDPATISSERIEFGATVTFLDEEENKRTYSIVGTDEIDVDNGRISWKSPIASALLKSKEGDCVTVKSPKGTQDLEVVEVVYRALS